MLEGPCGYGPSPWTSELLSSEGCPFGVCSVLRVIPMEILVCGDAFKLIRAVPLDGADVRIIRKPSLGELSTEEVEAQLTLR